MADLTHVDQSGKAKMVNVSAKDKNLRTAEACAIVESSSEVINLIKQNDIAKGDVLATARIAGIMAAKKTAELIPLCHPIFISEVSIDFKFHASSIEVRAFAETTDRTGIEMEAMTAVSVAALTIYDMCKGVDKSIAINKIQLEKKTGGKSGNFLRKDR